MAAINRQLNLVIPIAREDGTTVYIHSTPIRPETFEFYHMVLAKTWSGFIQNGLDPRSAPSVAALILKDTAKSTARSLGHNWWDGQDGVGGESGLLAEITRLSNVIHSTKESGWSPIPLHIALSENLIDAEEKAEVMNLLTFFTVASVMPPRPDRKAMVEGMASINELQTTLFNSTEYANSLKMSTPADAIGESTPA